MSKVQIATFAALGVIMALQILILTRWPTPTPAPVSSIQSPVSNSPTPASPSAEISQQLTFIRDELVKLRADQRDLTSVLGLTTAPPAPTPVTNLTVDANYPTVNVYDQPFSAAPIVGRISPGRAYPYTLLQDNWYRITLPDGTTAWVETKYVKPL
ncbi:MAG: hypothetical protein UX80_C0032G0003 [Candidatus Amesbacteria bacterium GW2011_GWA2_47_11b]|uniref:SH3b domain-containing protein n=1 Tax=Candidatus Amesbacteria bacterium GW2011_GWA2_47_11b TaxID=1618358 RepID=A0A0G1RHU1_9BACT|nr:MAG: hypothetical protein UX80_C0032G0003 [Candidatus Amesbacteria bacterium GW2011_GWA2_47_11b]